MRFKNWFKYRLPHDKNVICGASSVLSRDLTKKGFAINPYFNVDEDITIIPFDFEFSSDLPLISEASHLYPATEKREYLKEVEKIATYHAKIKGKTVAARCIRVDATIDLNATFNQMSAQYPDAFVFMFSTVLTGTWIGASPELLLEVDKNGISTMALAGTRPAHEVGDWDEKNVDEQMMVTDYIVDVLDRFCDSIEVHPTYTRQAGIVAHICTPITANLPIATISDVLLALSPTPALCGSNKIEAMRLISKLEKFEREMYGGFCGPNRINGITAMYVIVRCAKCSDDSLCIYAGAGITKDSDPEAEWKETDMKSKTLINCIKSKLK